jgi:hypothetical protein
LGVPLGEYKCLLTEAHDLEKPAAVSFGLLVDDDGADDGMLLAEARR